MNNKYPGKNDFPDRDSTLKHLRERSLPKDYEQMDALSKRAFRGLQALESPQALENSLRRLDRRFDNRLQQHERPAFFGRLSGNLRIAASILIILVPAAAWFLLRQPATPVDANDLFNEYFAPTPSAIPLSGTLRGGEESENLKNEGIKAYEAAYYVKAISSFEAYLRQQPGDTEIRFYFGVSLLARRQALPAIDQLSVVYLQPPRSSYRPAAAWYLSLAYLQAGQEQQAVQYLQELAKNHGNDYQHQAVKLLKQLGHDVSSADTTTTQPGLEAPKPIKAPQPSGSFF